MKTIASISIYSGLKDPEMILNEETSFKIMNILYKAYEPSDKVIESRLGFTGYLVYWLPEDIITDKYPITTMRVFNGIIQIQSIHSKSCFKDTVGLEKFTEETLRPLVGITPGSIIQQ